MKKRSPSQRPSPSSLPLQTPPKKTFSVDLFLATGFLFLAYIFFISFLSRPFSVFSNQEVAFFRGLFLLLPFIDPVEFFRLWLDGSEIHLAPLFQPQHLLLCLGFLILLGQIYFLGWGTFRFIRFLPRKRFDSALKLTLLEKNLFSITAGIVIIETILFWTYFLGNGESKFFVFLTIFDIFFVLSIFRRRLSSRNLPFLKNETKQDNLINDLNSKKWTPPQYALLTLLALFALLYFAGSLTPPMEYDSLEYHAEGAREFIESGQIGFADHNAYLNMPLGTETLSLLGILTAQITLGFPQDFAIPIFYGVCLGKIFIGFISLFTAFALYAFALRFFRNRTAGLAAALCYLAFPENFQAASLGLNDSVLGFFLILSVYALFLGQEAVLVCRENSPLQEEIAKKACRSAIPFWILSGLAAGGAAACKYTAIPFIVFPIFLLLTIVLYRIFRKISIALQGTGVFGLAALFASGGWYFKNLYYSGNPFWPLAWSIFGDKTGTWDAIKNARWSAAHSSDHFGFGDFISDISRTAVADDFAPIFLSVLGIFLLIPLFRRFKKRYFPAVSSAQKFSSKSHFDSSPVILESLFLYSLFFILFWWGGTHRLLRFLVPVYPILALLLGTIAASAFKALHFRGLKFAFALLLGLCGLYSLNLEGTTAYGLFTPYSKILNDPSVYGDWNLWIRNHRELFAEDATQNRPPRRLLLVGDARGFAYFSIPILTNTCWDNSRLRSLLPERFLKAWQNDKKIPPFLWMPEDLREIRDRLQKSAIGWILVDNAEIRRFLSPGNYGLTDSELATPEFFQSLQKAGILEIYRPQEWKDFSPAAQKNVILYRVLPSPESE